MKGIIWVANGNNLQTVGKDEFDNLIWKYKEYQGIEPKPGYPRKREMQYEVLFTNEDWWIVRVANDNARGYKCNISYIDLDIVYNIIKPAPIAIPWSGERYFN